MTAECLSVAGGSNTPLDRLRELQQILGDIHDRAALLTAVPQPARGATTTPLAPLVNRLERERRAALRRFERLAGRAAAAPRRRRAEPSPETT